VPAGANRLALYSDTGGYNVNYINVLDSGGGSSSGSTVSALTWNIQINDSSESHARQAMAAAMAGGPRPQIILIEEAYLQHHWVYIDELQRQTGQTWRGVFASHCQSGQWNGGWCN